MSIKTKKYSIVAMSALVAIFGQAHAQDLFDDSFLNDPENKSISIGTTDTEIPVKEEVAKAPVKDPAAPASAPSLLDDMDMGIQIEPENMEIKAMDNKATETVDNTMPLADAKPVIAEKSAPAKVVTNPAPQLELAVIDEKSIVEEENALGFDKKSPSEAVIGSLSQEMFKEMADLEKENSLLNLQLEKEKLKNEINTVKALQRQSLMDEIEKREMAARAKIEWEFTQEEREIELWEKRQKAELLAKQIDNIVKGNSNTSLSGISTSSSGSVASGGPSSAAQYYYILEVRGSGDKLTAKIADENGKKAFFVKPGSFLPTGHEVKQIDKEFVRVSLGGQDEILSFTLSPDSK